MLTAQRDSDSIVAALNAGANDYVTKPYRAEEFRRASKSACEPWSCSGSWRGGSRIGGRRRTRKRLFELLPMCAWCRKIRNDENYWNDLETFLTKSGVKISHGVCPECAVKVRAQWEQELKQIMAKETDQSVQ